MKIYLDGAIPEFFDISGGRLLSCTSYLCAIGVPVQWGLCITKHEIKLKICAKQVPKKISNVEGCAVYLLRMLGMEITQKWTKQEANRKQDVVFSKLLNFPFTLSVKNNFFFFFLDQVNNKRKVNSFCEKVQHVSIL